MNHGYVCAADPAGALLDVMCLCPACVARWPSRTAWAPALALPTRDAPPPAAAIEPASPDVSTSVRHDFTGPARNVLMDALLGPCAPTRYHRRAWFQAPMPAVVWQAMPVKEWGWSRPYTGAGPLMVLDLTAAWPSAMTSAGVALSELEHTGRTRSYAKLPGYYEVRNHEWTETAMPHPLGNLPPGTDTVWVTTRAVDVLRELVAQERWPEAEILDAWTGERCSLGDWARFYMALRVEALGRFGRGSEEEDRIKTAMSRIVSGWYGSPALDRGDSIDRADRVRKDGRIRRADWAHTVWSQAAYNLWQLADDARRMLPEDLWPVEMRRVDELLLPAAAWPLLEGRERPALLTGSGKKRAPIKVDPHGLTLGSVKIKAHEDRTPQGDA